MNLTDLHYVVEIDKSGSISKAAKELYVAQPNLSKAIKHLEREFGISIFERSSKGVKATREGQKFLEYAKRIIYEIEEMKRDCSDLGKENLSFKITVPRASYISSAFAEFIGMQSKETAIKAEFQESSSMHAIENVLQNGYSMGIIRYLCENEPYFQSLLDLKGLDAELLAECDGTDNWTPENLHRLNIRLKKGSNRFVLKMARTNGKSDFSLIFTEGGACTTMDTSLGSHSF